MYKIYHKFAVTFYYHTLFEKKVPRNTFFELILGCLTYRNVSDKDTIGLLCFTNVMIGIISGIGLMFLCKYRHKTDEYERFALRKR